MSLPSELLPVGLLGTGAAGEYTIDRSLRFNSSDSAYLSRTPASAGNRKTWTYSFWFKLGKTTGYQYFFSANNPSGGGSSFDILQMDNNASTITFYGYNGASFDWLLSPTAVFRDPSAWQHFVIAFDTTQATASDRVKWWHNGNLLTLDRSGYTTYPSLNADSRINNTVSQRLSDQTYGLNSYLADFHFIDGQALTPSSFTEVDATTGQLIPIRYQGSYGTNGFHLPFSDNSTAAALGTDTSGNGNDWDVFNIVNGGTGSYVSGWSGGVNEPFWTFDGTTSNGTFPDKNTTITWTAPNPISFTSLRFYVINGSGGTSNITINGTAYNLVEGAWNDLSSTITSPLQSFSSSRGSAGNLSYVTAIEVDGIVLVDQNNPGNDSLVDTPTNGSQTDTGVGGEVVGNYATLNPLNSGGSGTPTITNGNLDFSLAASVGAIGTYTMGTIAVTTGKYYWEVTGVTLTSNAIMIGLMRGADHDTYGSNTGVVYYGFNGNKGVDGSFTAYGATYSNNDVIGVALDLDAGTVTFYKNNSSQGSISLPSSTSGWKPYLGNGTSGGSQDGYVNFGQRIFTYQAPEGFKALCTTNLPEPVVANPSEVMDVVLYTGNGSTQTISGLGFSPDLVWFKSRSAAYSTTVYDTVRGAYKALATSVTNAEGVNTTGFSAFNTDGFSFNGENNVLGSSNVNGVTYVAWSWDAGSSTVPLVYGATATVANNASLATTLISTASPSTVPSSYQNYDIDLQELVASSQIKFTYNASSIETLVSADGTTWVSKGTASQTGGATVTVTHTSNFRYIRYHYSVGNWNQGFQWINNTEGSITSQVRANPSAGFSVATLTTPSSGNFTVGHGLNIAPNFVICKARNQSFSWLVYHKSAGAGNYLVLNTTAGSAASSTVWQNTDPSSTLVYGNASNWGTADYVMYSFAPVAGYSSFGSYTGNGSAAGPFVFCGFRPRWLMVKRTDAVSNWFIYDSARNTFNIVNNFLRADLSNAEAAGSIYSFDFLSNGFKLRSSEADINASGGTFIYACFAESPFQYSRAR